MGRDITMCLAAPPNCPLRVYHSEASSPTTATARFGYLMSM
eukprot:SAG11_NODE_35413_length_266_cov_1.748503_1_plen_40_part_01